MGWVQAIRSHKGICFLDINDGSCIDSLQVVAKSDAMPDEITIGCSVQIEGSLVRSKSPGQSSELKADIVKVIGECNPQEYPFKPKARYHADFLRQLPHLRSRNNIFSSLLRIRNAATIATHKFFQDRDFLNVHTPIITSNDCEGAGELFAVKSANTKVEDVNFFNVPAYLTVSGQLHLECMACSHSKVYTIGPTFRAENSKSRKHLSEFYMVEAEIINTKTIEDLTQLIEDFVKETTQHVLEERSEDVCLFHKQVAPGHREIIDKMLKCNFNIISYTEAIALLEKNSDKFINKPFWGCDLNTEHEVFLVHYFDDTPTFVVNFPSEIKAFYARENDDSPQTVSAVDLLVPGIGELVGGSLREERTTVLEEKLKNNGLLDVYDWYVDLRRFGSVPHGGFGLGFERYLQFLLGVENIKDVIPFPRFTHSCRL
ncbi:asparaginyl-tRNA synthetase-like isoform X3 [Antedon mediterranea]|uniref:asparaginyl-tRNA synthetase-like isoform X2 n=1 Tax=Antedon mediterranea TaxID=105859 RepID=UPI003AF5C42D